MYDEVQSRSSRSISPLTSIRQHPLIPPQRPFLAVLFGARCVMNTAVPCAMTICRLASQREEAVVAVLCICDGIPCRKCGKGRIHRPISNYWDEARGALIHCPWFSAQAPCDQCRAEQQPRIA